jgi:hypothetical protein
MESAHLDNEQLDLKSRNWNWRVKQYKYGDDRALSQPGYVGRLVSVLAVSGGISHCLLLVAMLWMDCAWR